MTDNLTIEQRRFTMSRIRARDTKVELIVRRQLFRRGHRFRVNASWLPGKPDIVFTKAKLAVFVDGDFWHGWKFDEWSTKLAPYWRDKITRNRARDRRCAAQLRRQGWSVMRLWEHEVEENIERCIARIERAIAKVRSRKKPPSSRGAGPQRHARAKAKR